MDGFEQSSSSHCRRLTCLSLLLLLLSHLLRSAAATSFSVATIPFSKGFTPLFGHANIAPSSDDTSIDLALNQYTGSGFKSSEPYSHGLFSARIKLPSDYTAGIVVAFYTSNGDIFEKTHDELDLEFMGNIRGKRWKFQTNVYGNGSTHRGREERYHLWFDPTRRSHLYTILWTGTTIIFYIDEIPIREITRNNAMGADFPSKPMSLYATIWDASDWATSGGKYKVNYKYAPFVAKFSHLVLHGCATNPIQEVLSTNCSKKDDQLESATYANVTPKQRLAMKRFRQKYMYYSYCYDMVRYPIALPECVIDPVERGKFKDNGRLKLEERRRRHVKRRSEVSRLRRSYGDQEDEG